jgi:hypothetical protein
VSVSTFPLDNLHESLLFPAKSKIEVKGCGRALTTSVSGTKA